MAKLMKNRTDNDIKNKWNSMKRLEKRKIAPIRNTVTGAGGMIGIKGPRFVEASRWITTGGIATRGIATPSRQTTGKIPIFTTMKTHPSMYSSELDIAPTVTDGGSAENSPVPKKMYWDEDTYNKYEV